MYRCPDCEQWCSPSDHQCLNNDNGIELVTLVFAPTRTREYTRTMLIS